MPEIQDIAAQLLTLTPQAGHFPTAIDGITLMRADTDQPPAPVLQEPTLVFMGQGLKRGYLGDKVFHYHAGQGLIVAVPMHFNCDTVVGEDGPMLALAVRIDMNLISEIISKMQTQSLQSHDNPGLGMIVAEMQAATQDTLYRLLRALASPEETRVLGVQLVRELHYRVLQGTGGACLGALAAWKGRLAPIFLACDKIHRDYGQELDVPGLASEAAMSISAFYQAFKSVTGYSPIQYLKATRLQRARELIIIHGKGAAQAAYEVGYSSASQFSREFKRFFGYSPAHADASLLHA